MCIRDSHGVVQLVAALDAGEHAVPAGWLVAVDVAPGRAEVARPGHGRGDDDLLDVVVDAAAGHGLVALDALAGDAVLDLEVVLFLDIRERVASIEPVSYTHLDVYKRQPGGRHIFAPGAK